MYDDFEFAMEQETLEQEVPEVNEPASRTRGVRRKNSIFKAIRKRQIDHNRACAGSEPMYDNLHQYSKNKVHCSCKLCRSKSNDRNAFGKKHSPTAADMRKLNRLADSEKDAFTMDESA